MEALWIAGLAVVVIAFALAITILWDRLVGKALVGVTAAAMWIVAQSVGRWWFWPVAVLAVLVVVVAFVVAVLIS
jgi:hypothetical protein